MTNICGIKSCSSRRNNKNILIYHFPENPIVRQQWIDALLKVPKDGLNLCNMHFQPSDFINQSDGRLHLKKAAVPSRNLESSPQEKLVCRACLSEGQASFQSISGANLDNYYTDLTRIDLVADFDLTKMLCTKCSALLILFNFFKTICVRSNNVLKQRCAINTYIKEKDIEDKQKKDDGACDPEIKIENEEVTEETTTKTSNDEFSERVNLTSKSKDKSTKKVQYKSLMRKMGYVKCNQCDKTFKKLGTFYKHRRDHDTTSMCDLCGHQFSSSRALRTHHIFKHQDERKYICDLCDFSFKVKASLEHHMQSRHTKDRNYVCDRCSATFKSKRSVQGHIRMVHSNIPLIYGCDQCDKKFKTRAYLIVHKNSHTGLKMFSCPLCRTEFSTKKYRDTHIEKKRCLNKPFQCHLCMRIFKVKRNHTLHMRRFHPEIPASEAKAVLIVKDGPIEESQKTDA